MPDDYDEPTDDPIGHLLREHMSAQLDGQIGRASAHFRRQIEGEPVNGATRTATTRRAAHGWALGLVGGAVAASMTLLFAGPALWPARPALRPGGGGETGSTQADPSDAPPAYTQVVSRTIDEGTYLVDDHLPVRRLRRQRLEQTTWYDPAHDARMEVTIPREDVMLVELVTY